MLKYVIHCIKETVIKKGILNYDGKMSMSSCKRRNGERKARKEEGKRQMGSQHLRDCSSENYLFHARKTFMNITVFMATQSSESEWALFRHMLVSSSTRVSGSSFGIHISE